MTDLDRALREMFHERAGDIQVLPESVHALDAEERATPRTIGVPINRRSLLVAALVAALVVALAIGIVRIARHHHAPPATQKTQIPTGLRSYCPSTLPPAWPRQGTAPVAANAFPRLLTVTPDGGALIVRRADGRQQLVLVHGSTVRPILTVPDALDSPVAASVAGDWASILIGRTPATKFRPYELDLVNLRSGARRVITRTRPADLRAEHNLVWGNALIGGHLYWATNMSRYPQAPFRVHVYDLASGQASTRPGVATTPPVGTAYGVSYDTAHGEVIVRNALPPTVAAAMGRAGSAGRRSLVTDGSAYAWIAAPGHVAWWRPGQPAPTVFREPYPRRPGLLVAGTYVMLGGVIQGGDAVLDVRTGAVAPLTRSTTFRAAGAGVFWGDGGAFAARTIVSVPVAGLPELHCD